MPLWRPHACAQLALLPRSSGWVHLSCERMVRPLAIVLGTQRELLTPVPASAQPTNIDCNGGCKENKMFAGQMQLQVGLLPGRRLD